MGYIGRSVDKISNIETLDNITFDGSTSYSLTKNSVAFVPSASQNILISIDGVVQSGNFTVSGSTIDFGVAISSSSVCNFIIHLGVGIVTTPSDGSVGTSQLASGAVNNSKIASDAAIATTKLGTGAVLQVVSAKTTTQLSTGTSAFVATDLSASITPSSTSSKIVILADGCVYNGANGRQGFFALFRGTTNISGGTNTAFSSIYASGTVVSSACVNFVDTPNTTSSTTYTIYAKGAGGNIEFCSQGTEANIILMEIAG